MMKRTRKIAGCIFTVLCLFLTGQVIVVMTRRIRRVPNPKIYKKNLLGDLMLCSTLVITALDIWFGFFTKWKSRILRFFGWVHRIVFYALSGVIMYFGISILIGSLIRHRKKAEYAIVLGLALENGKPAKDLLYRVNEAEYYLSENPNAKLVLTGGNPDKDGRTEAEVMEELLLARGVPKEKMILENKSDSTKTNFRNTLQILGKDTPVVLITNNYHMNRAVRIARKAGFSDVIRMPARSDFFPFATNVCWEILHNINEFTGFVKDT